MRGVSVVSLYKLLLYRVMKLAGLRPQKVEIEEGSVINFWVPSKPQKTNNPAVVLLHGFAADGTLTWQFQILALAGECEMYIPDLVFFGDSTTDKSERSPEFQAACVAEGLKKLGVEKCLVGGFSYGGFVAFKMAEMYGEMVESIVVSGSFTEPALDRIGGFAKWSEYLLPRTEHGVRVLFDVATFRNFPYPNFLLRDCLKTICGYEKKKEELLEALATTNKDSVIPKYTQKIHLIWGENDRIFPLEDAKNLKLQLGENAELHIIEKAGHLVMLERPFVFNTCFKKILASHHIINN